MTGAVTAAGGNHTVNFFSLQTRNEFHHPFFVSSRKVAYWRSYLRREHMKAQTLEFGDSRQQLDLLRGGGRRNECNRGALFEGLWFDDLRIAFHARRLSTGTTS